MVTRGLVQLWTSLKFRGHSQFFKDSRKFANAHRSCRRSDEGFGRFFSYVIGRFLSVHRNIVYYWNFLEGMNRVRNNCRIPPNPSYTVYPASSSSSLKNMATRTPAPWKFINSSQSSLKNWLRLYVAVKIYSYSRSTIKVATRLRRENLFVLSKFTKKVAKRLRRENLYSRSSPKKALRVYSMKIYS